ncbi:MAG: hypothetical protein ACRD20_03660 [Terriglobales bacterium]
MVLAAIFVLSTLFSLLTLNTVSAAQQASPHKHLARVAKKPAPTPPPALPAPPPPPPTLEQMPAQAPQVHYSGGQLTIVAENSTLGDILRAVRTQTGAMVEVPPNATERVVTHLGPGPARSVLAALLNGSHFNYVMLGSAAHPNSVDKLILTSKSSGAPEGAPTVAAQQSNNGNDGNNQGQMDDPGTPGMDIAEQPVEDPGENTSNDENQSQPQEGQSQIKTPEQLLHELQLQQQQLQQQQPQPPPAGGPPPQGAPR